jgi:hypothetical protein
MAWSMNFGILCVLFFEMEDVIEIFFPTHKVSIQSHGENKWIFEPASYILGWLVQLTCKIKIRMLMHFLVIFNSFLNILLTKFLLA